MANYNNQYRLKFETTNDIKYSCYGCTNETGRKEGCHSSCEKYINERKLADVKKEKRDKIKKEAYSNIDTRQEAMKRMRTRRNTNGVLSSISK